MWGAQAMRRWLWASLHIQMPSDRRYICDSDCTTCRGSERAALRQRIVHSHAARSAVRGVEEGMGRTPTTDSKDQTCKTPDTARRTSCSCRSGRCSRSAAALGRTGPGRGCTAPATC